MSVHPHLDACEHAPYCCITHRLRPYWCRVCNTRALFPELHPQPSCPVAVHPPMLSPQLAIVPTIAHTPTLLRPPACQGTGQICTRRRADTCPDSCPMTQAPLVVPAHGGVVPATMVVAPSPSVAPSVAYVRAAAAWQGGEMYPASPTCHARDR